MIGKKLVETKKRPLSVVEQVLDDRQKKTGLNYEQELTKAYLEKFKKVSDKNALKIVEELTKIEGVEEDYAVKMADLMPKDLSEIKTIYGKRPIEESILSQALEVVQKYNK